MDKNKKIKIVISVFVVFVCGVLYLCGGYFSKTESLVTEKIQNLPEETIENTKKDIANETVYIHICRAVKQPGVYAFKKEPRVVQVVKKAGGFTKNADRTSVNQAEIVTDGTQLRIQKKRKHDKGKDETVTSIEEGKVNINTATKEELMTLSGIGESKADAILSYRETNGAFQKTEDIMNIPGIKEGVFSKVKESITV